MAEPADSQHRGRHKPVRRTERGAQRKLIQRRSRQDRPRGSMPSFPLFYDCTVHLRMSRSNSEQSVLTAGVQF